MQIEEKIKKVLQELGVTEEVTIILSIPEDMTHGDYSTNVAFRVSKVLKKSPIESAQEIATLLQKNAGDDFAKIEAVKPGFINFYLSEKALVNSVQDIVNAPEKVGRNTSMQNKKIMVEFTDPNPFKEFHIGHLYSNTVGESICRILEAQGAVVKRANYFGDVGLHVAKAIWGMISLKNEMPEKDASIKAQVKFMGKAYAAGATAYEEDEIAKEEIKVLNKKIYEKDKEILPLYDQGREWSLEYFESIYLRLGMSFDYYYPESKAGPVGLELVKQHIADGIFEEDKGAVIFRGEKYGLHTRVFINSLGLPTYEAKELGLAPSKYKDFAYDVSLIITANEIDEYFKVLLQALKLISPDLGNKTLHMSHGVVRLPEGKMSSRTGKIVTGEWLLDSAKEKVIEKIHEAKQASKKTTESEDTDKIADQVGVGAVKYAFLKSAIGKDIEFDFDTSLSFEGNSGPYLQYSFVRTQSILDKAQKGLPMPERYIVNADEATLLRKLYQFEHIVSSAGKTFSPSLIATYLYELAKQFSFFYQSNRIADAKEKDAIAFRVILTNAVGMVLERGLHLLGIETPKHM